MQRTISTGVHQVIDYLIDHIDNEQNTMNTTNDVEMGESYQQSSIISRLQTDDDIVEIEGKLYFFVRNPHQLFV